MLCIRWGFFIPPGLKTKINMALSGSMGGHSPGIYMFFVWFGVQCSDKDILWLMMKCDEELRWLMMKDYDGEDGVVIMHAF